MQIRNSSMDTRFSSEFYVKKEVMINNMAGETCPPKTKERSAPFFPDTGTEPATSSTPPHHESYH